MMVQAHDNDWLYILRCDFQLRTEKINYHIHVHHVFGRYFAHHEITQNKIDCHLVDRIAVAQWLQPCLHFVDGMNITLQNLLLQGLRYLFDILNTIFTQPS